MKPGGSFPWLFLSIAFAFLISLNRKSFIGNNEVLVQRFTNAIYRGQLWVEEHSPEEIANSIKPSFHDADLEILAAVAIRYKEINAWAKSPLFTEESFTRLQDVMELAGELDKRAPYDSLVTNLFAERAM